MDQPFPALRGRRLLLERFVPGDAETVRLLAGDPGVAAMTQHIPHPYPAGAAEVWIAAHARQFEAGLNVVFAIRLAGSLVGCVNLQLGPEEGELGYWIGKPFWGQGYATEAVRLVVGYAFGELGLARVTGRHLVANPASGRVMEKAGLAWQGLQPGAAVKDGHAIDLVLWGASAVSASGTPSA